MTKRLSTKSIAEDFCVTQKTVQTWVKKKVIKATKEGRDYRIHESELEKLQHRRPRGRPRKQREGTAPMPLKNKE